MISTGKLLDVHVSRFFLSSNSKPHRPSSSSDFLAEPSGALDGDPHPRPLAHAFLFLPARARRAFSRSSIRRYPPEP